MVPNFKDRIHVVMIISICIEMLDKHVTYSDKGKVIVSVNEKEKAKADFELSEYSVNQSGCFTCIELGGVTTDVPFQSDSDYFTISMILIII